MLEKLRNIIDFQMCGDKLFIEIPNEVKVDLELTREQALELIGELYDLVENTTAEKVAEENLPQFKFHDENLVWRMIPASGFESLEYPEEIKDRLASRC
jgi:hypothetical protein